MTEKDLDIAIEKCERIMEMDTRTMQNPVSENGHIFEKVYDLLKFLRQFEFETGGMDDTISRQAAISICDNAIDLWNGQLGTGALVAVRDAIMALPFAQPEIMRCKDCKYNPNPPECGNAACVLFYGMTDQMGFCHHGERRERE